MAALLFEIRVAGPVPTDVLDELREVRGVTESVETLLRGPVRDQAELIGIINRLQSWGIDLHSVRQLVSGDSLAQEQHQAPPVAGD